MFSAGRTRRQLAKREAHRCEFEECEAHRPKFQNPGSAHHSIQHPTTADYFPTYTCAHTRRQLSLLCVPHTLTHMKPVPTPAGSWPTARPIAASSRTSSRRTTACSGAWRRPRPTMTCSTTRRRSRPARGAREYDTSHPRALGDAAAGAYAPCQHAGLTFPRPMPYL